MQMYLSFRLEYIISCFFLETLWWRCNVFPLEICFPELSSGYDFPIDPSLSVFIPRESRYEMYEYCILYIQRVLYTQYFCEYCIYSEFIQATKHNKDELVSFQKRI